MTITPSDQSHALKEGSDESGKIARIRIAR
jgi:hypothetical protein